MNAFERIIYFLDKDMNTPNPYGWFHLLSLLVVLVLSILIIKFRNKFNDKNKKIILAITTIVLLLFEVYKQLVFSYDGLTDEWNYQWYAFPFQFCSTPMYVLLVSLFLKKNKVVKCIYSYLSTYGMFAGIAVMLYPVTVFISTIGINIQTMVHHGAMVLVGIFLLATNEVDLNYKTILRAIPVFLILLGVAQVLNIIMADPQTFNMFFIAYGGDCEIPVLSIINDNAPYVVFLLTYILGFSLIAFIILNLAILINKLYLKICNKLNIAIN